MVKKPLLLLTNARLHAIINYKYKRKGEKMLDKAIKSGKEWRQPYKGAKAIDAQCRNHGSCTWCQNNRLYATRKVQMRFERKLKDFEEEKR